MKRTSKRGQDDETSYWLSYSDMMCGLLLTFVLLISCTMLQATKQFEDKQKQIENQQSIIADQQEKLDGLIGVRGNLIGSLKEEFDGTNLKVLVDQETGSITFDSSILFDTNEYELKDSGKIFLQEFLPIYFGVLTGNDFKPYVSEIIIEGHTDTDGNYLYNLELSQKRALSVAEYCLNDDGSVLPKKEVEGLRKIVTANGRSFSNPVVDENNVVNMDASRRVEFKFRLKDEDMIKEMLDIING